MLRQLALRSLTLAAFLFALSAAARADPIVLGQTDTFQTGPQGWIIGFGPGPEPRTPLPVVGGGQGGAGDNYLLLSGTGLLPREVGSSISALNDTRWAGNYIAAGVNAITMDVRNFGPSDLSLRLVVVAIGPTGPQHVALTADAVFVPVGDGWSRVTFLIGPEHLMATRGTAVGALTNASVLRLFHNPAPEFFGRNNGPPPVNARLGVDNITAAAIPEPATVLLLGTGLLGTIGAARRRRRAARGE